MAYDEDWIKVMGDDFVPLNSGQVPDDVVSEGETPAIPAEPAKEVVEGEPAAAEATPTEETQATETVAADGEQSKSEPTTEESTEEVPAEPTTEDTPSEEPAPGDSDAYTEAEKLIDELLGAVKESTEDKEEQGEKLEKAVEKSGDAEVKKELEEYKLREEQMLTKAAALTNEYKKLLDQKNILEAQNEENTAKMQIISDNPLMQDLLRALYLEGRDPSAVTNMESTLKSMLKQYAQIDVDELASKTRDASAESLSPSESGAVIGEGKVYQGLFDEGDIVPLGTGE